MHQGCPCENESTSSTWTWKDKAYRYKEDRRVGLLRGSALVASGIGVMVCTAMLLWFARDTIGWRLAILPVIGALVLLVTGMQQINRWKAKTPNPLIHGRVHAGMGIPLIGWMLDPPPIKDRYGVMGWFNLIMLAWFIAFVSGFSLVITIFYFPTETDGYPISALFGAISFGIFLALWKYRQLKIQAAVKA